MKIRGKIYNIKTKGVYTIMSIDFVSQTVVGVAKGIHQVMRFKDTIWLQSTGIKADNNLYIYQDDFIVVLNKKDELVITGIVKKFPSGEWYLVNKKLDKALPLFELKANGLKFITRQNHKLYFAKKNKQLEK